MSWLVIVDFVGVGVFAVSGALAAGRKSLDLLGVVVIAIVTSIGGGTLRVLLLDRPIFWIGDPSYLTLIVACALATVVFVRFGRPPEKALLVADALGLALFAISGAQIAEQANLAGIIVVTMATITAVFGGVLRDVLCAEIPMILRKGHIYATAVIAGATLYVLLQKIGAGRELATGAGMFTVAALRLAAIWFDLMLPVFSLKDTR
ncbi:MAG TPA: trimeric intracellular cation channel family protein [Solimonas sp.]|nr:trimeric intracellular cation channel family protein [Solimonas sp.]